MKRRRDLLYVLALAATSAAAKTCPAKPIQVRTKLGRWRRVIREQGIAID